MVHTQKWKKVSDKENVRCQQANRNLQESANSHHSLYVILAALDHAEFVALGLQLGQCTGASTFRRTQVGGRTSVPVKEISKGGEQKSSPRESLAFKACREWTSREREDAGTQRVGRGAGTAL